MDNKRDKKKQEWVDITNKNNKYSDKYSEFSETLKKEQDKEFKNINYAIDLNTGEVKQNPDINFDFYLSKSNKEYKEQLIKKADIEITDIKKFKKEISKYKDKVYTDQKELDKDVYNFNKMFNKQYIGSFTYYINDLLNKKRDYISERTRLIATIVYYTIINYGIYDFIKVNVKDFYNNIDLNFIDLKDYETIQKELSKHKTEIDSDKLYTIVYDIALKKITTFTYNEILENEQLYKKVQRVYKDVNKTIKDVVSNFNIASDSLNGDMITTKSKVKTKLPQSINIDFDIMKLFNNVYPNYKYKSIDTDRHKDIDIKAELMLDLDMDNVSSIEDLRLINFLQSGQIQLFPIQNALINGFISIRDFNGTPDKTIELLSTLKYITENKQMRLPTRKQDLSLYEDFMLFFDRCKIQIKIVDRKTKEVYYEISRPIPLLENTPAKKEGRYGYVIGNSVISLLKNELDELYEKPKQTTHLTNKQYLNAKVPNTPPMINLTNYIYPKIASMINTYKTKKTYQSKIDISCLYSFQALYKKKPKADKEDKRAVRELLDKYLNHLKRKDLIVSYEPIKSGKEINTYKITINKNATI